MGCLGQCGLGDNGQRHVALASRGRAKEVQNVEFVDKKDGRVMGMTVVDWFNHALLLVLGRVERQAEAEAEARGRGRESAVCVG